MPDNDFVSAFQKDYAKGKWLKHHELVSLYYEVKESLVQQNTLTLTCQMLKLYLNLTIEFY